MQRRGQYLRPATTSYAAAFLYLPYHRAVDMHGEGAVLKRGSCGYLWHVPCGDDDGLGSDLPRGPRWDLSPEELVDFGVDFG